jgi:pimeloyl-ACP methyl ester carboxylesterase
MTTGTISIDRFRIRYRAAGKGIPVILVHGSHRSSYTFGRSIDALAREFLVIAPDLPGYGRSSAITRRQQLPDMPGILIKFAEALGLGPYHWVGESRGGGHVIQVAARRPSLARSLLLVSPVGLPPRELPKPAEVHSQTKWEWFVERSVDDPRVFTDEDRAVLVRNLDKAASYENRRLAATTEEYNRQGLVDCIVALTLPIMLVWGRQDPVFPVECVERFRELILDLRRVEIIDLARHLSFFEHSSRFNSVALEFFRSISTESDSSPFIEGNAKWVTSGPSARRSWLSGLLPRVGSSRS